ncbi:MAG: hypothetical protein LKE36_02605 [Bacilli bacterium]|nr:hypothetical protein [Bacilli bacterium]MCH4202076.1 hypothetical protein [Bacilli bacterium]
MMKRLMQLIDKHPVLVFLDFEGTQISHEMIALGAVLVTLKKDGHIKKIHKGYKRYVIAHEKIGSYVEKLTGIKSDLLLKEGVTYKSALEELKKYIGKNYKKAAFITFGSHDIRILHQSLHFSSDADGEIVHFIDHNHIDFSDILSEYVKDEKNNPLSLANYCLKFGVEFEGTPHDPYFDALNLAYLYEASLSKPDILYHEYLSVLSHMRHLPVPIQKTISKLVNNTDVSASDFGHIVEDYIKAGVDRK